MEPADSQTDICSVLYSNPWLNKTCAETKLAVQKRASSGFILVYRLRGCSPSHGEGIVGWPVNHESGAAWLVDSSGAGEQTGSGAGL